MHKGLKNTSISISDSVIEVRHADHIARRYDFNGNVVVDFVIDEVWNMHYETTELLKDVDCDDENLTNKVYGVANCQQYMVRSGTWTPDYYGLLNRNGEVVTPPIYTDITAISKNRYLCQPQGVIIDDNGNEVE